MTDGRGTTIRNSSQRQNAATNSGASGTSTAKVMARNATSPARTHAISTNGSSATPTRSFRPNFRSTNGSHTTANTTAATIASGSSTSPMASRMGSVSSHNITALALIDE